jgi:carbon monoxide dehydrogenase subunit G
MELEHSFTVPVPEDQAWDVLLDVERVAPCMPGATLDSVAGDEIKGKIKVKLGPVSMTYAGTARFTERDRDAGVVILSASGKETRGAGTASAIVRSELHGEGDQTEVTVHTSLNVTGRPAQFGRGVMADVSAKLIGIFAKNLADMLGAGNGAAPEPAAAEPAAPEQAAQATDHSSPATITSSAPTSTTPAAPEPSTAPAPAPAPATGEDSLNLLQVAGLPVLKRIAAPAGALLAVVAGVLIWRRRRRK